MTNCKYCKAAREAFLQGRMAEAAGLTITAFRAKFGLADPFDDDGTDYPVTEPAPRRKTKA